MGYWNRFKKAGSAVKDYAGEVYDNPLKADVLGSQIFGAYDRKDKIGDVYNDVTGVTTAREMGDAQEQALDQARSAQEQGYQRSQEQLSPYAQAGGNFLEGLAEGVEVGAFRPRPFNYGGEQPDQFNYQGAGQQGESGYQGDPNITSNYQGQQQGGFNYGNGQQSQSAYRGGPEMGSIESFMGDPSQTPGYQFQLEQGQKAIDRAAAAGGRFGGGQTAKELMRQSQGMASQAYGDEFNRASQEREAQRFGEQSQYGRGQDAMQARNQAENIGYGRDLNAFNMANQAEQSAYGRAENQAGINRQIESDQYGRSQTGLDRMNQAEQSAYNRDLQGYGLQTEREQQGFGRDRQLYNDQVQRTQDDYNRQLGMTNMGMDASTMMSNAALGQGSALSNLAIQQGNANAAQIAGEGTTAGNLLNLAGQGAQIYGAFGGAG